MCVTLTYYLNWHSPYIKGNLGSGISTLPIVLSLDWT